MPMISLTMRLFGRQSKNDDSLLADLMIQWEEALEQGRDVSAADLCKDCPHLVGELSRRIEALRGTSWMDKPVGNNSNDPPPTETPDPETPPRTLVNRYRLDQKVAEGGFAQVWKGYDLELLRTIAVKMPKPPHIGAVDSFMAEARRVARLKHPGIVPVHDVGKDGDDFFIVSEFVEDGSLGDRLKQGPIPPEQSCRWLAELADALDYALARPRPRLPFASLWPVLEAHRPQKQTEPRRRAAGSQGSFQTGLCVAFRFLAGSLIRSSRYFSRVGVDSAPDNARVATASVSEAENLGVTAHRPY